MACNTNLTTLDTAQAVKKVIDAEHDAIRIIQALNTEFEIELSSEDGDSVESVARTRMIDEAAGEVSCSDLRRVMKYGTLGTVEVSPDGTTFHVLSISDMQVKEICAVKIRVTDCVVVGQS